VSIFSIVSICALLSRSTSSPSPLAADVAAGAVESGDFSEIFLQEYVERCEKEFNYDLKSALKFANFAYGHRDLFLKALW